jgi:hypothetical protein
MMTGLHCQKETSCRNDCFGAKSIVSNAGLKVSYEVGSGHLVGSDDIRGRPIR